MATKRKPAGRQPERVNEHSAPEEDVSVIDLTEDEAPPIKRADLGRADRALKAPASTPEIEEAKQQPAGPITPGNLAKGDNSLSLPHPEVDPVCRQTQPSADTTSLVPGHDVYLNQTNIVNNYNKFYKIQLLSDTNGQHAVWARWGRTGEPSRRNEYKLSQFFPPHAAFEVFTKKFKDQTGVKWEDKESALTWKNDKYTMIEMQTTSIAQTSSRSPEIPLGQPSKAQLQRGREALDRIHTTLDSETRDNLPHLSNVFYTLIPHAYRRHQHLPVIDNEDAVADKLRLLDVLEGNLT